MKATFLIFIGTALFTASNDLPEDINKLAISADKEGHCMGKQDEIKTRGICICVDMEPGKCLPCKLRKKWVTNIGEFRVTVQEAKDLGKIVSDLGHNVQNKSVDSLVKFSIYGEPLKDIVMPKTLDDMKAKGLCVCSTKKPEKCLMCQIRSREIVEGQIPITLNESFELNEIVRSLGHDIQGKTPESVLKFATWGQPLKDDDISTASGVSKDAKLRNFDFSKESEKPPPIDLDEIKKKINERRIEKQARRKEKEQRLCKKT